MMLKIVRQFSSNETFKEQIILRCITTIRSIKQFLAEGPVLFCVHLHGITILSSFVNY